MIAAWNETVMYQSWNDTVPILRRAARREQARQSATRLRQIVLQVVSFTYSIPLVDLEGPSRGAARVALARQIAMYLVTIIGDLDHAAVGRLFNRDRTTVAHACAIVEDRRDEPEFDHTMFLLKGIVENQRDAVSGLPVAEPDLLVERGVSGSHFESGAVAEFPQADAG